MKDETFGPVIPVMKVSSDEEAVTLMNDSEFGLTASIWTKDTDRGYELADQVEAGTVFVNRCDFPSPVSSTTLSFLETAFFPVEFPSLPRWFSFNDLPIAPDDTPPGAAPLLPYVRPASSVTPAARPFTRFLVPAARKQLETSTDWSGL